MRSILFLALLVTATAAEPPQAFTTNCAACHLLDQSIVGPSLVEVAKVYKDKPDEFLKWCVEPGKKRPKAIQMPSMAHVQAKDLTEIYNYIQTATKGVVEKKTKTGDPYADEPHTTRRPRIQRTFLPNTGPASLYVALPGEPKLNLVWDTDQCRLRYITEGEPVDWPYLQANGDSFAKTGKTLYTEAEAPLSLKSGDTKPAFQGYKINGNGLPTFLYKLGSMEITETISGSDNSIARHIVIKGNPSNLNFPSYDPGGIRPTQNISKEKGLTNLTLTHTRKN